MSRSDRLRLVAPVAPLVPDVTAALATLEEAARTLETGAVPAFVGALECVKATAWARLLADGAPRPAPPVEDRLLTIKDVQRRTTLSAAYLYRHADALPFFAKRIGRKVFFSEVRLTKWLAQRGT